MKKSITWPAKNLKKEGKASVFEPQETPFKIFLLLTVFYATKTVP